MVKIAKKAKIENVNFDVLSFGEDEEKTDILHKFITTISGKERTGSHLVNVPPGRPAQSNPVNPDDDPELALALRVSMEEQRARQQAEGGAPEGGVTPAAGAGGEDESSEEAMLQRALAMSMDSGEAPATRAAPQARDLGSMTEEEQIAYAMQVRIFS